MLVTESGGCWVEDKGLIIYTEIQGDNIMLIGLTFCYMILAGAAIGIGGLALYGAKFK